VTLDVARPRRASLRALVGTRAAAPVAVAGLIVCAFVARVLLARYVEAPWIEPDELRYALVGRSFLSTGHYLFREHAHPLRTIYPALISPAWLAGSSQTAYFLIKAINVGLMVLGAIPLYLWSRRLVAPLGGVLAVVLYLAMPGFIYTGEILTENAFVPGAILAMFAIASALERPTLLRQALAFGAIVLVSAARLQGLVLLIVLATSILLVLVFDAVATAPGTRRELALTRLRQFWPSLLVLAVAFVGYGIVKLASGGSIARGLGTLSPLASAHYSWRSGLRWVVFHFGELAFAVGLLPLAALVVLVGLACRRSTAPPPAERAFLAVATAAVFWVVVQAGVFASSFSLRVEERYMLSAFPVLFLALAVWLGRGLPRPAGLTAAAVLVPVAFLLALPYEGLVSSPALFNDTFGLIPVYRLTTILGGQSADVRILVAAGALLAVILFAGLPRVWASVAVPAAVGGFLLLSSGSVFAQVTFLSRATRHAGGLAGDPSWIDHAVGKNARVEVLDTTDLADPHIVWQAEFWNRSVRRVFGVTSQDPSIPDVTAPLDTSTGRIQPGLPPSSPDLKAPYVVAAASLDPAGTGLARAGALELYRVRQPLGLAGVSSGVYPDAWMGSAATYTRYRAAPHGQLRVLVWRPKLSGPPPAHVRVSIGRLRVSNGTPKMGTPWATQSWTVRNGTRHLFTLPLRRVPAQVQVTVSPTFSPTQYGSSDTRALGVLVSFGLP
jgi:hypothetical protein